MRKYIVKINELFLSACICMNVFIYLCHFVCVYMCTRTWKPEVDDGYRSTTL